MSASTDTIELAQYNGQIFKRPDTDGHKDFQKIVDPKSDGTKGWGKIVTPEEIRLFWIIGNGQLVTTSGDYITDDAIDGLVDLVTGLLSGQLQFDIYPTMYRHRPIKPEEPRIIGPDEQWDDAYPYEWNGLATNTFRTILRHYPLMRVEKWQMYEPYSDTLMIDLLPGADIHYRNGMLRNQRFAAQAARGGSGIPLRSGPTGSQYGANRQRIYNSFYVDYATGYESAQRVPHDLRFMITYYAVIFLLSGYGDGIAGGLANASLSLGTISESFGTTMSATSSWFGSRIEEMMKWMKQWWDMGAAKYSRPKIAFL